MSMSFWVIFSWILVFILTAINVVVFLQLKKASEQMMKMAPMMQNMMGGMQGKMAAMQGGRPGSRAGKSFGNVPSGGGNKQSQDAQLKAAMDMLNKMQKR